MTEEYPDYLAEYISTSFRYNDYFSSEMGFNEAVESFKENYTEDHADYEERLAGFRLNYLAKCISELKIFIEDEQIASKQEVIDVFDSHDYFEQLGSNACDIISYLIERRKEEKIQEGNVMDFEKASPGKQKIFFAEYALDDMKKLPKKVLIQVIKKINNPLATELVVPLAEAIEHTKDRYDIPLLRIRVSEDYRVAFLRRGGVTCIVGANKKSGNDPDYERYDSIGARRDELYREIDDFDNGIADKNSVHNRTMTFLRKAYEQRKVMQ